MVLGFLWHPFFLLLQLNLEDRLLLGHLGILSLQDLHHAHLVQLDLVLQQPRGFQALLTVLGVLVGQGILMFQELQAVPYHLYLLVPHLCQGNQVVLPLLVVQGDH